MDAEPLAYTPHPAAKPKVTPMYVAGSVQRERSSNGLAAIAGVALVVMGTGAMMGGPRADASEQSVRPVSVESVHRAIEPRAEAPVQPAAQPAPVELRASSPLPIAGDEFASSKNAPANGSQAAGSLGSGPTQGLQPTQQFHALTSFDNRVEMTSGNAAPVQVAARGFVPPAPVVWNRPIRWIQTNDLGGGYSGGQIR